jgi:hypothetical protein
LLVPVTLAVKVWAWDTVRLAELGLTLTATVTASVGAPPAPEVPPPGLGVWTVTVSVPEEASWEARMMAVSSEELTTVVVSGDPLRRTTDWGVNAPPFTVSVRPEAPALTVVGEMELTVGGGLTSVIVAAPLLVPSAALVAVTLTLFGVGGTLGAV